MIDLDTGAERIRDAFDLDLAAYQAPPDLAERARRGGLRRARRRRQVPVLAGLTAAAGAAALVVTMLLPGGGTVTRTTPGTLTAWTVTREAGNVVQVVIRDFARPAALSQTLRADGVPAVVYVNDGPACHESDAPGSALRRAVTFVPPAGESGHVAYNFHLAAMPANARVAFEYGPLAGTNEPWSVPPPYDPNRVHLGFTVKIFLITADGNCLT
jgi:hypothetical protein